MTQPGGAEVGTAYVSLIPSARGFARKMRGELDREFKDANFDDLIEKAFGGKPIKLPVKPDIDPSSVPDKLPKSKAPKLPVELDPLVTAFQTDVKRQLAQLAKQVNLEIPATAETGALRAELATALAQIQQQLKVEVPTEPDDVRAYEAKLKAAVEAAASRVKANTKVDIDVDVDSASATSSLSRVRSALADVAGEGARMGGQIAGAFVTAAGPAGAVVVALGAIAGAAAVGVSAVSALAGAIAALPGAIAGAGAAFGALSLGFSGIADAFKPKAGGGGGGGGEDAASRARRIAGAERGVAAARRAVEAATRGVAAAQRGLVDAERNLQRAQERSRQAQQAVNRARKEAAEDLEDLNRQLRGAKLDEQDAALAVEEALRRLNEAKETGNLPDIQRANLEYEQAKLNLENAADAAEDLGEAQADATKKGIEGSDKVQQALEDQRDAADAVRDAQNGIIDAQDALKSANDSLKSSYDGLASATDALAEAQKKVASGGGGGGIADIIKLAPEAQKFVAAIKRLKPAFEDLRLDVQNRLFKDLDDTVTNLGEAWIPALKKTLGSYADTFNGFFRDLGRSLGKPQFIRDIQDGAEGARRGLEAIGQAVSGPLVEAFGALSSASAPFLEAFGEELASIVEDFANWILQAEKSRALTSFFDTAVESMRDLFTTGRQVGRLVKNLFNIITGGNGKDDKSAIDSVNDALDELNDWLEDPRSRQQIADFIDEIKQAFINLKTEFDKVRNVLDGLFDDDGVDTAQLGETMGKLLIAGIIGGIKAAIEENWNLLGRLAKAIVDNFKEVFGIESPSTVMAMIGRYLIDGLKKGVADRLGSFLAKVREMPGRVRAAIGTANRILYQKGRDIVAGAVNGMGSYFRSLSDRARGIRTTITNQVVGAGSWLYNAGRNVVIGLWNGIASLGSWLAGKVAGFIDRYVPEVIQNQLGIASPSKVAAELGSQVPAGLAIGIESGSALVESAARSMADAALPTLAPIANPTARVGTATYGAGGVELYWRSGATSDPLLDGLRQIIGARYRGDVVGALSSG